MNNFFALLVFKYLNNNFTLNYKKELTKLISNNDQRVEAGDFDYKTIDFLSFDKKRLTAYIFLANQKTNKWIVGAHGFSSNGLALFNNVYHFYNNGYNLALIDFRSHGNSEYGGITFGVREAEDLKALINFIKQNYKRVKFGLLGVSMGGMTINNLIQTNHHFVKKNHIKFAISDAAPFSLVSVIKNLASAIPQLKNFNVFNIFPDLDKMYRKEYQMKLVDVDFSVYANQKKSIPFFYIGSKEDEIVSYLDAEQYFAFKQALEKNRIKNKLKVFEKGRHSKAIVENYQEYVNLTLSFAKSNF